MSIYNAETKYRFCDVTEETPTSFSVYRRARDAIAETSSK